MLNLLYRSNRFMGLLLCIGAVLLPTAALAQHSVARIWNEELLFAIRRDQARPTIHARNLFHVSIAMWDAWAAFEPESRNYLLPDKYSADDVEAARAEALSVAVYRILRARFADSPGAVESLAEFDRTLEELGYDRTSLEKGERVDGDVTANSADEPKA